MSAELFDYIKTMKTTSSDDKEARAGLLIMHCITGNSGMNIDNLIATSKYPSIRKVLRTISTVRSLAFALKIDMTCTYNDGWILIPEELKLLCEKYHIGVEAYITRNKVLEGAHSETWDLVILVEVALEVMVTLHEETLHSLDESHYGHRPTGHKLTSKSKPKSKSKSKWIGLVSNEFTPPVRARGIPRAGGSQFPGQVNSMGWEVPNESSAPSRLVRLERSRTPTSAVP